MGVPMRGGDGVPQPAAGADFLAFFFARFFTVSWEFGAPCDTVRWVKKCAGLLLCFSSACVRRFSFSLCSWHMACAEKERV